MTRTEALLMVLSTTASLALADQVTLKNGDRLTGAVLKSDAKALTLKSEFAGTVAIDWNARMTQRRITDNPSAFTALNAPN